MLRVEETERVEDIFSRMDSDADGFITIQEHRFIFLQIIILKIFFKKIYSLGETFGGFELYSMLFVVGGEGRLWKFYMFMCILRNFFSISISHIHCCSRKYKLFSN